jgi:HAD superfamily hydrolase (TIGR01549 family)
MNIQAIIWDYDGTLVDTRHKNLNVTRNIIAQVSETNPLAFSALQSLENYVSANRRNSNWREFYSRELQLTEPQIDEAGRMWTTYQIKDDTDADFYDGIKRVIRHLSDFPLGIVSQNSRSSIVANLQKNQLLPFFKYIVGYEEVDLKKQKPEPDGLLDCIEKLSAYASGYVCYIGDHETDVHCARAANQKLQQDNVNIKIISIGACYDDGAKSTNWRARPDFEAHRVEDILDIVDRIDHHNGGGS